MTSIAEVRKTYKYQLYTSKRDTLLHDRINIAGIIWNHITALQRRYYALTRKFISMGRLQKHIARLRMKTSRFAHWQMVGSQAVQGIIERHDAVYQRFFKGEGGRPRFKKVKKYKSFTLKQAGYTLLDHKPHQKYRTINIQGTNYKFVYHRPLKGTIKTVTIKRDAAGRLWVCFSIVEEMVFKPEASTGQIGGFDFGLKTFLVNHEGDNIAHPQFYTETLPTLRTLQKRVSKKNKPSNNSKAGQKHIARQHIRMADKRRDFHYQLAHDLCDLYDVMVFEDLNIEGMKQRWGRQVSDLGFSQFLDILKWVAFKRGKRVIQIGRWERTTGICHRCKTKQTLDLSERTFRCQNDRCGLVIDRDHNAAINILEAGHRLMLSQSIEDSASKKQSIRR